jgi:hypothetical protein
MTATELPTTPNTITLTINLADAQLIAHFLSGLVRHTPGLPSEVVGLCNTLRQHNNQPPLQPAKATCDYIIAGPVAPAHVLATVEALYANADACGLSIPDSPQCLVLAQVEAFTGRRWLNALSTRCLRVGITTTTSNDNPSQTWPVFASYYQHPITGY